MIINHILGSGGTAYDVTASVLSDSSSIVFSDVVAEPKAWAVEIYAQNGLVIANIGSGQYLMAYIHGGDLNLGVSCTNSALKTSGVVQASYDAEEQKLTLTAQGTDKFKYASTVSYRLIYTI